MHFMFIRDHVRMGIPSEVYEVARSQHALVLVAQTQAAGMTRSAARHAVASSRLDRVSDRVLRLPGAPTTDRQQVLAAVLDVAPGAYGCGPTAAALWGVPGYRLLPAHVVRPVGRRRRSELGVMHEIARLSARHVTVVDGIPTVRPEVVVLQLCGSTYPDRAASALDNMWRRRLLSGRSLRRTLDDLAASGRNGVSVMRELLDTRGDDYVPPASNLERRFATILERAGEPPMRRQVDSGDDDRWVGRVDFRDERRPLIVEVQSETFHSSLVDKEHDARRLAALREAGFDVIEVTDEQVWHRPHEVVVAVRDARRRPLSPT